MLVLSNSIDQTVLPGQSITFDTIVLNTGRAECHRPNSGVVNLTAKNAIYELIFNANIGSTTEAEQAQLAIAIDNSALLETTMISTTSAAGDLNNVSSGTLLKTCCCIGCESVTVINTGTTTVNIGSNPCLRIKRVA
jgi:hypothetical protein